MPAAELEILDRQLLYVLQRVREVAEEGRRQQHELMRAEQLSAVGQLAAGVAHEIRNPLTSIKVLVEVALRQRNPRPFTRENLEVVHCQIARLERTVQEFLNFARPATIETSPCDLRQLAQQAVSLIGPRARQQQVTVDLVTPDDPLMRSVDARQFSNVVVNLLLNALDAMPQGGRMSVELAVSGEDGISLSVADTGKGIPAEMLPRLFTPFTSSKATGTGLGLCISRRIVEEHGGVLRGGNRPEGGARFVVTLPAEAVSNHTAPTEDDVPTSQLRSRHAEPADHR